VGLSGHAGLWPTIGLVTLVLLAALAFVGLRSATERQSRRLVELRLEREVRAKERENLRVELETYKSGSYILAAVNRLGLKLRPPLPGQVRRVSLSAAPAPQSLAAAAREQPFLAQN